MFWSYKKTADNGSGDGGNVAVDTVLKAPANTSAIDISNIAGVHRTKNGKTPNDLTFENPDDLYTVQRIFDTLVENTARTTPAGQKIVYVIGENHFMPTQILAPTCLNTAITNVHGPSSHVFCHESEYNFLERIAQETFGLTVPDNLRGRLHEYDPHGRLLLQGDIAFSSSFIAPESAKIVLAHALHAGTPVMFTDTGRIQQDTVIDPSDPVARDVAMQMYKVDLTKERLYTAPEDSPDKKDARGVDVRNGVMVARALDFAKIHGARVLVQHCGNAHIFGDKQENISFKNSLSPLFAAQNCRTVPIFFSTEKYDCTTENIVPDAAWAQFPDAVILRGVSEQAFSKTETKRIFGFLYTTENNLHKERAYVDQLAEIYKAVAGVPAPFDVKPDAVDVKTYINTIASIFRTPEVTPK